jgi:LytS/YehU family sensor histidine kinase
MITNFFNDGALMRCGLFLGCQTLKNYYLRSEEKAGILRENATAELQLLKAQVHPHFLFNTLNNIYSFSLSRSPFAASLVLKLSDTLRYMITECEAPLVPLEKELKMLNDYIGLESVRYGTRLNVEIKFEGDTDDKMIAPLLLIPLVENSFKHGTSQMLEQPWIRMIINTRENDLEFHLSNSKPEKINTQDRNNGIGT